MFPFHRWLKNLVGSHVQSQRTGSSRRLARAQSVEALETRVLLAVDFGDAPDATTKNSRGDYQTTLKNGGPGHTIDATQVTLFLGGRVDADAGTFQSADAASDDRSMAADALLTSRNDEDGVIDPADLQATVGDAPVVRVRVTNLTSRPATVAGWLDFNRNGVFENTGEQVLATVAPNTDNEEVALKFTSLPYGSAGITYLRLRLSTDAAAANSIGLASDGEVEDHRFAIQNKLHKQTSFLRSVTIGDRVGGGPDIDYWDFFGWDSVPVGDINRDGVADLVVSAPADGPESTGAVYVLLMTTSGTVKAHKKIGHNLNGGPRLSPGDFFGNRITSLGDVDGDGVTDIAVGASGDDTGGIDRGAIYIVNLTTTGTAKKVTKIASGLNGGPDLPNNAEFSNVESIGDINRDGIPDLLVGAPSFLEAGRSSTGVVFLLTLASAGNAQSHTRLRIKDEPYLKYLRSGEEIAFLGDQDGDGTFEIAMLGHEFHEDLSGVELLGRFVDVFSFDRSGAITRTQRNYTHAYGHTEIGMISSIGDVNGDGFTDIGFVVVPSFDSDEPATLRFATLDANGRFITSIVVPTFSGPKNLNHSLHFYASTSVLGDNNNDGSPEIAVGMPAFTIDYSRERIMGGISVLSIRADLPKTGKTSVPIVTTSAPGGMASATTFHWPAMPSARTFEIRYQSESTGLVVTKTLDADVLSFRPEVPMQLGTHNFQIRAINELGASAWSPVKVVRINTAATTKPVAPQFLLKPKLSWNPVVAADGYVVRIYDRKSGKLLVTTSVPGTQMELISPVPLPAGEYEFDVNAVAKDGLHGLTSPRNRFQTEVAISGGIHEPPVRERRTIWFTGLSDAVAYEIEILRSDNQSAVNTERVTSREYVIKSDLAAGKYQVRVRPIAADGSIGRWASLKPFVVEPAPRIISYTGEVDGTFGTKLTIKWTPYPNAEGYEVRFRYKEDYWPVSQETVNSTEFSYQGLIRQGALTRFGEVEAIVIPKRYLDSHRIWLQIGLPSDPITIVVRQTVWGVKADPADSRVTWAAIEQAAEYQVQVFRTVGGVEDIVLDERVSRNEFLPQTPLPMGTYRIRVRAIKADGLLGLWSSDFILVSRPRPVLINSDSRWISHQPTLQWEPLEGAVSYDVLVRHKTRIIASYSGVKGTSLTTDALPSMRSYQAEHFEWVVSANIETGPTGVWSVPGKLWVGSPPARPRIAPGEFGHLITWDAVSDAVSYDIEVRDSSMAFVAEWAELTIREQTMTTLVPGIEYRFWVRARDASGAKSLWSVLYFSA